MTELKSTFSAAFNESGFEASIDWGLSRREFADSLKRLFSELQKNHAAIPLSIAADIGAVTCLLASIDCKGCTGLCCNRASKHVLLSPDEASRLGVKQTTDAKDPASLPLPCRFLKKAQCSIYSERPAACRFYPVQFGGSGQGASGTQVIIGLDSLCPESARVALRVYMTSYDLARAGNKAGKNGS